MHCGLACARPQTCNHHEPLPAGELPTGVDKVAFAWERGLKVFVTESEPVNPHTRAVFWKQFLRQVTLPAWAQLASRKRRLAAATKQCIMCILCTPALAFSAHVMLHVLPSAAGRMGCVCMRVARCNASAPSPCPPHARMHTLRVQTTAVYTIQSAPCQI